LEVAVIERFDPWGRMMSLRERQLMERMLEDAFVLPRGGPAAAVPSWTLSTIRPHQRPALSAPPPRPPRVGGPAMFEA
jgi:hypothetical protein